MRVEEYIATRVKELCVKHKVTKYRLSLLTGMSQTALGNIMNMKSMWNSTGLGTLGRIAIYKEALNPYELAVVDSHVTVIRPLKRYILSEYLYFYFSNPSVQSVIEVKADGTTKQKELATSTIKEYYVPIPPLEEQKRIIAKINEILLLIRQC